MSSSNCNFFFLWISENGIDEEAFRLLEEDEGVIPQLFPLLGDRVKFKKQYRTFMIETSQVYI